MRAAVLRGTGDMGLEQRAVPALAPDEVLVRIVAVGVCGSDCHYYEHGRIGPYVVDAPLVLGHEASGVIAAVGADVPAERLGSRVAIEPQRPCRRCAHCKAGRDNLCPDMVFLATPPVDGAFVEYLAVPADFAHDIPSSMSADAAALLEPLSVGIWACQKAAVGLGSSVFIAGAGPIGVITAQVARAAGATRVVVSDVAPGRLEWALRFGATGVDDPTADDVPDAEFDAFIDASGVPAAIRRGIAGVRPAGSVVLVGMGGDELSLPVSLVQNRELQVTGVFRYANTWPSAIALAGTGTVDLDGLVTEVFGLDEAEQALRAARDPRNMKVVVRP
ncbi:MAG: NAD(P)-dependent alcohol dehydrogenase [Pseudolysinimonas sp.]